MKETHNVLYPILFEPNMHEVVWGGHRLENFKGLTPTDSPIGESWEVSAVPSSVSVVANGCHCGRLLTDVIAEQPEQILGAEVAQRYDNKLPLLAKFIDARDDLSIQVHPNDEMAKQEHGKSGKTEMWYVIDAEPGSTLRSGFAQQIDRDEYFQRIADGTITDVLATHQVHPGDVFFIPSGRVHAIGRGILLAEIQQSSDVTYRIFDYNRPGIDGRLRELHTELASRAIDYHVESRYRTPYTVSGDSARLVVDCPFFSVRVTTITAPFHRNLLKYGSFVITMCISGGCVISIRQSTQANPDEAPREITLRAGNSCLIPAAIADYDLRPLSNEPVRLLDAYIDTRHGARLLHRLSHLFNVSSIIKCR